ncbi:MAG TPA: hypothetical protein VM097_04195 [Mycobacteriales bacterium]|nr:hypothetical protein [Mycobacteriales bacterium]
MSNDGSSVYDGDGLGEAADAVGVGVAGEGAVGATALGAGEREGEGDVVGAGAGVDLVLRNFVREVCSTRASAGELTATAAKLERATKAMALPARREIGCMARGSLGGVPQGVGHSHLPL